jgi:GNAT superfamily N-acetyltransferase
LGTPLKKAKDRHKVTMATFHPSPPIPAVKSAGVFVQTIQLKQGDRTLGHAIWTCADPEQGVLQLIELWIDPAVRRSGHGRRLFRAVIEQAREYHKMHRQPLRRVWIGMGHKSQVVGRSFLTGEGFHHISSTGGLLKDEDQLIYVKSLD